VDQGWQVLLVGALAGVAGGLIGPAQNAFLMRVVAPGQRSATLAYGFTAWNLGLGLGGVLAAVLMGIGQLTTYRPLFLCDAVSYGLAFLLFLGRSVPAAAAGHDPAPGPGTAGTPRRAGYLRTFRDPVFLRLWLLTVVLVALGYGQLGITVPVVVIERARLASEVLGLAFTVQTATIVLAQLGVLRLLAGRTRTWAVTMLCALWSGAWLVMAGVSRSPGSVRGAALTLVAAAAFALGETFFSPSIPAMVNDIAPDELRGQYNAGFMLAFGVGNIGGSLLAGLALGQGLTTSYLLLLAAACLAGGPAATRLGRHLPGEANAIAAPTPAKARA
jgi:MFS family permease